MQVSLAYYDLGDGLMLLCAFIFVGIFICAWILYWTTRAGVGNSKHVFPVWWILVLAVGLIILVCFPPMRRAGEWYHESAPQPAPLTNSKQLDRSYFGYIPKYSWIGTLGSRERLDPPCRLQTQAGDTARCENYEWVVDWPYLFAQILILVTLTLPFLLRKREGEGDGRVEGNREQKETGENRKIGENR